ncbi:uncharacterized protein LOC115375897 [Myripristis murdjan]|uniref:uncharacterized protein LOC115375897 n=1 Tax=Myripristis murdjan TaxID=586833 RepID=UPI001175EDD9|nr:uncharacterized protein LOC115375897 [Myripristis murdjan]
MDILNGFEIYIPREAEVKTIALWSLPRSMLKSMGLLQADRESSRNLAPSPEATLICPAVVQRRNSPSADNTAEAAKEHMSNLLSRKIQTPQGPFQMSFVSSSQAAYRVLDDVLRGKDITKRIGSSSPFPLGPNRQDAVVIYCSRVYLSVKRPKRVRSQRETHELNPAGQASPSAPESQKTELLRKKDGVTAAESKEEFMNKDRSLFSSKAACCSPHHKVDSLCRQTARKDLRGKRALDKDVREPAGFQEKGEPEEVVLPNKAGAAAIPTGSGESQTDDSGCHEARSLDENSEMDLEVSRSEANDAAAVREGSNVQSWTGAASFGLAFASTHQGFDFEQLAQEEEISRMRAKVKESEAALNTLQSSK